MHEASDFDSYCGDVNLEYGGFFANVDTFREGYVNALRVTDLDSGCGFDGAVLIERLTVTIPTTRKVADQILSCCGWSDGFPGKTSQAHRMAIVDACLSYGYYDPDEGWNNYADSWTMVIQIDEEAPMQFDGWRADVRLDDESLLDYLTRNGYLLDLI